MTTAAGRSTVSYLVKCALPAGHQITKQDQYGTNYTFPGSIGLAPQYETGACDTDCQEAISACMMAHVNTAGIHIPLWIVGPDAAIGWGQSPWYARREATFFGNIFTPDSSGLIRAHYCEGTSDGASVVPGRIGADQSGLAPYTNPYGSTELSPGVCDGFCQMNGCDGPSSCPADGHAWKHPITVWRGETFQAENAALSGRAKSIYCAPDACSESMRVGYIDATSGVTFNYVHSAAGGTQSLVVYYANGDTSSSSIRRFNISVNGGAAQNFSFPVVQAGNWNQIGGMTIALGGFVQGGNNTVKFLGDGTHPAPDLDWIEVMPGSGWTSAAQSAVASGQTHDYGGCDVGLVRGAIGRLGPNASVTVRNIKASVAGTRTVIIYYSNADSVARSLYIKVNGNPATLFSKIFKPTAPVPLSTPDNRVPTGSTSVTLGGFVAGTTNTVTFSTDATFSGPFLDFIEVN